ncbi:MAG: PAS domain S-box protein, partial [Pseudomonadota bacterium]|nr:PAS domain S-box protein [Pseudomonadota bacterium]
MPVAILRSLTLRRAIVLAVVTGLLIPALLIGGLSYLQRYNVDIQDGTLTLLRQNIEVLSHGMQDPLWNVNQESAAALLDVMLRNEDIINIEVRDNVLGVFVAGEHPERRVGFTAQTTQPLSYGGKNIGTIHLEVGSARLRRALEINTLHSFAALTAQVVFSIFLILVLLEFRLVRPLQRLSAGAERLARGQLDMPIVSHRADEIGRFGQRLELTRISLRNLFEELGRKNFELERDLEIRRHIERELHERETRFRVLVEQSPIAIIEWDLNFRVIEWNAAAEQIFGYPRRKALGQHAGFIIPNRSAEQVNAIFRRLMAGQGGERSISENIRADGQIIICQWRNAHIADQPGQVGRLMSMAEDITEKRRADEALTLSESKFAGAFQCNPDSVSIARLEDGLLIDVNQTFESITGYARDEAVGKTSEQLAIWAQPEQRKALIAELRSAQTVRDMMWDMRTRYGEIRTCMINATVFSVGSETYLLAVIRDVTDQRRLEAQKAEVDRALLRLAQGAQQNTGAAFFDALVADLASALRTDIAFIAVRSERDLDRVDTLAIQVDGQHHANRSFRISGAPCELVLRGEIALFPQNLKAQFPGDPTIDELRCESYAGAPIRNAAGHTIGLLAVAHGEPLGNQDLIKTLLRVFSERASAELEREQAERDLRNSEQRFSAMFHASPIAMALSHYGGDYSLIDVNEAFERLHRRPRNAVLGKNAALLSMYVDYGDRDSMLAALQKDGKIERFQTRVNLGDGATAIMQMSGNVFELLCEQLLIMVSEDVTEMHAIEQEILASNTNLEVRVTERTDALQRANAELASTLQT